MKFIDLIVGIPLRLLHDLDVKSIYRIFIIEGNCHLNQYQLLCISSFFNDIRIPFVFRMIKCHSQVFFYCLRYLVVLVILRDRFSSNKNIQQ